MKTFLKTLVLFSGGCLINLLLSTNVYAQTQEMPVGKVMSCGTMGYIKAGHNPRAQSKAYVKSKFIAQFYEKQYLCILDRSSRYQNWFYVKAVPFNNKCEGGVKNNPECLPIENKRAAKWLSKRLISDQPCRQIEQIESGVSYKGNCPTGWIHRKNIHFFAG